MKEKNAKMTSKSVIKAPHKASRTSKGKKRRNKRVESCSTHIYRVLKQVHPDAGTTKKVISIMNSFINDVFECVATESGKLTTCNKKATSSYREIK